MDTEYGQEPEPEDVDGGEAPEMDRSAAKWLDMLRESKECFDLYNEKSDNIDKMYGDIERLADSVADREFQIFWANLEVLKPTIYARPPIPVVVPKFKDREELPTKASEMLERALGAAFEMVDLDYVMRQVRDDLAMHSRGVMWLRYDDTQALSRTGMSEKVCFEHIDRKDFLHDPERKWADVDWVARRAWLTKEKGEDRFGEEFKGVEFKKRDDDEDKDHYETTLRAPVWEMWCKSKNLVVWVSPGKEEVLDIREPFLDLQNFFPCPRPAYATLQRRSLVPISDYLFYKDQVEEVNEMTARISALAEALRMKGFYASGAEDIGSAIEAAMKNMDDNAILIPVSNFAALGGNSLKDAIVWLPVREVADTVVSLIALRKEMISDIYEITGLSDIMRGSTAASETATAQTIKAQYGSVRIREKQSELIRIAKDATLLAGEIMAENFSPETMVQLSQMNDLPTDEAIQQQVQALLMQVQQVAQSPEAQMMAQQSPEQVKQIEQQVDQQIKGLEATVTIDKIMAMLRDQRMRPFMLDIETDSTIQPDENAAKQRATEFLTAVGGFMSQALPMVQAFPPAAKMATEMLKFTASQFRAGRELDGVIDEFAEMVTNSAEQAQQPQEDPEAQARAQEAQMKGEEMKMKMAELQGRMKSDAQKAEIEAAKGQQEIAKVGVEIEKLHAEIARINAQASAQPIQGAN